MAFFCYSWSKLERKRVSERERAYHTKQKTGEQEHLEREQQQERLTMKEIFEQENRTVT